MSSCVGNELDIRAGDRKRLRARSHSSSEGADRRHLEVLSQHLQYRSGYVRRNRPHHTIVPSECPTTVTLLAPFCERAFWTADRTPGADLHGLTEFADRSMSFRDQRVFGSSSFETHLKCVAAKPVCTRIGNPTPGKRRGSNSVCVMAASVRSGMLQHMVL